MALYVCSIVSLTEQSMFTIFWRQYNRAQTTHGNNPPVSAALNQYSVVHPVLVWVYVDTKASSRTNKADKDLLFKSCISRSLLCTADKKETIVIIMCFIHYQTPQRAEQIIPLLCGRMWLTLMECALPVRHESQIKFYLLGCFHPEKNKINITEGALHS